MSDDNNGKDATYWYATGMEAYYAEDYEEAVRCLTIAAEMGDADAQFYLADCYHQGEGVEKDVDAAIDWYARAADNGRKDAWIDLGHIADDRMQYKLAALMYLRAVELGEKTAKPFLGILYKYRRPINDFRQSSRWLREAVEENKVVNDLFYFNWGQNLELGLGVDPDVEEAKRWYRKAASHEDAQHALAELERIYSAGGTPFDWQQNGVKAWNRVYEAWEDGRGASYSFMTMRDDRDEAVRWWIRAAEAGNTAAMINLAEFFGRGRSYRPLPADKPQAHYWYRRAAELGDEEAQRVLAYHYCYGIGVPRDRKEARKWAILFARYCYRKNGEVRWYLLDELGIKPRRYRRRTRHVILWPLLGRSLLFVLAVAAIGLVWHMDRLTFVPITEAEALERAETVKVTLPDQTVRLVENGKEKKLAVGTKVTVLGVYKQRIDKGNSPRVYWTNQHYLLRLRDGSLAHGPLMETAVGHPTLLPSGDTVTVKAVKKVKKNPQVQNTGATSAYPYAYTLEGHKEAYALEDLKMHFPERIAYQSGGLQQADIEAARADTLANGRRAFWPTVRYTIYKIIPSTGKSGYFLYPRFQQWSEFRLQRWFRNLLSFLAFVGALLILFRWVPRIPRHIREAFDL
ncbi:MAG: SEL1-like repeat protein [Bacteroidales bacterium]|nr:SEL1-like repeat protein [Bacteroidales bacterium]